MSDPFGYTSRTDDGKPIDKGLRGLWPPGTFNAAGKAFQRKPGAQQQPKTSVIHPAPSRTGKRPAPRTVAQPKTPPAPKQSESAPGAEQYSTKRKRKGVSGRIGTYR